MALSPGTRFGPYEIIDLVGAGGMGEVYRATDTKLGREVAIKTLPPAFATDQERLARFEREAKLLATINHAYIAAIYWLDEYEGTQYLAMEFVEGETLEEKLKSGSLPVEDALRLSLQIAEGLEAAHEKGVVHRDLKPANVMVTPDGVVKVLDFGLAKAFSGDPNQASPAHSPALSQAMTQQGLVLGTAGYMSPEQASGQATDQRADIWAFGVVLYEMLTGLPLFTGESIPHILADILRSEPDWNRLPKNIHPRLRLLLERCLKKRVRDRYHSISDARIDIEDVLNDPQGVTPRSGTDASRPDRSVAISAAAVATVAVVGLLAVFVVPLLAPRTAENVSNMRLDVVTPPTTSPASFALSPDGRQLAFVADGESGAQLWVRPLDRVEARPLDSTLGAAFPFWAPDSSAIAFFADGQLKRVSATGGQPAVVASAPSARGGAWAADGVIVFAPDTNGVLVRADAGGGGTPVPLTTLTSEHISHRWPMFLPDGRRFLFSALGTDGNPTGVYLGSTDSSESVRVADGNTHAAFVQPGYLLVISRGALLAYPFDVERAAVTGEPVTVAAPVGFQINALGAFSVSRTGLLAYRALGESLRELVWIDRTGARVGSAGSVDASVPTDATLAPDGGRVAVARWAQGNEDIWLYDAARGLSRATDNPAFDSGPLWSPDGERIVFSSNRNGSFGLFMKSATVSGDERPLLVVEQNLFPLDWSPDGRYLLYTEETENKAADLWALSLDAEEAQSVPVAAQAEFDEVQGKFSPDGRWIAYASNRTGIYEIFVEPFPNPSGVGREQISIGGGTFPIWALDGTELYFLSPDNTLMAVSRPDGRTTPPFDYLAPVPLFSTRLVLSGTNIFPTGPFSRAQYAVAADGGFLMNLYASDAVPPINIVLGWRGELGL